MAAVAAHATPLQDPQNPLPPATATQPAINDEDMERLLIDTPREAWNRSFNKEFLLKAARRYVREGEKQPTTKWTKPVLLDMLKVRPAM